MEDNNNAKMILKSVVKSGNKSQKLEAKKLLNELLS